MRSDDVFFKNRMISFSVLVFVILTQGNWSENGQFYDFLVVKGIVRGIVGFRFTGQLTFLFYAKWMRLSDQK